jgi:glycosyltransferase involved in cell wall biosynthesis
MSKVISIFVSHPTQYHAPIFRELSKNENLIINIYYFYKHGSVRSYDNDFKKSFKWDGSLLKYYKYEFIVEQKSNIKIINILQSLSKIKKCITNSDAVLVFGWNNFFYLSIIFYAYISSKILILLAENNLLKKKNFLIKKIKRIIIYFFFKFFDYFLSIGTNNKNYYLYHGVNKNKIYQTFYTVDTDFFKNFNSNFAFSKEINKKFFIKKKNFIFIWVGKFIERKNPTEVIKAIQFLKNNNFHLFMIGSGPLLNSCRQYIKDHSINNIHLVGFKNQNQLKKFYSISNCLVLSSKYETWGLVLNEAMSSGLPCIATKSSGAVHDLIRHGSNGYIYNSGSVEQLAINMLKISNISNYKRLKKNALNTIRKFSLQKTAFKIFSALQKIIHEQKK